MGTWMELPSMRIELISEVRGSTETDASPTRPKSQPVMRLSICIVKPIFWFLLNSLRIAHLPSSIHAQSNPRSIGLPSVEKDSKKSFPSGRVRTRKGT